MFEYFFKYTGATTELVVALLSLFLIYWLFFTKNRLGKILSSLPGPSQLPLLGNTLSFIGPNEIVLETLLKWYKLYGGRFVYRIGSWWVAVIASAKDVEKVLSSQTEITKTTDYDQIIPWLGTGLLISSGEKWFHRRKMLTSAFHFKILEQFVPVFNEASIVMSKILIEEFSDGKQFDLVPYVTRCTLDIICETAMGLKINAQLEKDSDYIKAIHKMGDIQLYRMMRPWLESNFIWKLTALGKEETKLIKTLHQFTNKVIKERKEEFISEQKEVRANDIPTKQKPKLAFLDLLLEAQMDPKNKLTDDGIREETDTFMFEGHDTTAASVSFTIFAIGCHPEVQAKLHAELDEIFGDDQDRPVNLTDINRMKYLECCIKESLRLLPSVPLIARQYQNDFQLDKETIIPRDTYVVVAQFLLHRDREVFPNPEKYDPDRFLPENSAKRSPFAYVPFSAGPRNCIGQKFAMLEEKILLANVFRNLKIESVGEIDDLILVASMILRSKNGLKITAIPRKRN